ncbi:Fibronectin type III domain protein [compost metagenome]
MGKEGRGMKRSLLVALTATVLFGASMLLPKPDTVEAATNSCSPAFVSGIMDEMELINGGEAMCIKIRSGNTFKTLSLNGDLMMKEGIVVYGTPQDVPNNDWKTSAGRSTTVQVGNQPRYLGFTSSGSPYSNVKFPPDSLYNTNMSTRNWYDKPWEIANRINNRHKPTQSDIGDNIPVAQRQEAIKGIIDPYAGTAANPAGNFSRMGKNGKTWNQVIESMFVWDQFPQGFGPGSVTAWHKDSAGDWYETFVIPAPKVIDHDLAIVPTEVRWVDDHFEFEIWSTIDSNIKTDISIKWVSDTAGNTVIPGRYRNTDHDIIKDAYINGANNTSCNCVTYPQNIWQDYLNEFIDDVSTLSQQHGVELTNIIAEMRHTNFETGEFLPHAWGVMGQHSVTKIKWYPLFIPDNIQKKIDASKTGVIRTADDTIKAYIAVTVNPDKNKPANESFWSNNTAVFDPVVAGVFETPQPLPTDITTTTTKVYWPPVDESDAKLDRYELTCSNTGSIVYKGTNLSTNLTGLTPDTRYTCDLEAFSEDGDSGGIKSTEWVTAKVTPPTPTPPAGGDNTPSGLWKSIGLIREIDNVRQALAAIPKTALDYSKFTTANQVRAAANNNSPYFGEKLGAFGIPDTGSKTYSWTFTYQEWDWCKSTSSTGGCVGGYVTVTGTNSCVVTYPAVGPSGWTNITTDPTGRTIPITSSWGKTGSLTVVGATQQLCQGSDTRDPDRTKFSYFVPTEYVFNPAFLIDVGFNTTTQKIDVAHQNMFLTVKGTKYSLGSDYRTLAPTASDTQIPFKMMWSRYGTLGTGGSGN